MRWPALLPLIALLSACATALPQTVPNSDGSFAVRYDQTGTTSDQVDALAQSRCGGALPVFVSQETRFDGFAYRTYRCEVGGL